MGWRSILVMALIGLATSSIPAADIVWIEAERFENCGGWVNDAQFIDQMGSPYLLAAGMGEPVADAVTHVRLPRSGQWRLWVRDRDWTPQYHPGRFQVVINARAAGPVFGASGRPGWRWEDGGLYELGGRVELRLHDLTGYYGRCDALVLAADAHWTPPAKRAALAALRAEQGGVSRRIENRGPYDVVVVGAGWPAAPRPWLPPGRAPTSRSSRTGRCWAETPAPKSSFRRWASGRARRKAIRSIPARRA